MEDASHASYSDSHEAQRAERRALPSPAASLSASALPASSAPGSGSGRERRRTRWPSATSRGTRPQVRSLVQPSHQRQPQRKEPRRSPPDHSLTPPATNSNTTAKGPGPGRCRRPRQCTLAPDRKTTKKLQRRGVERRRQGWYAQASYPAPASTTAGPSPQLARVQAEVTHAAPAGP